TQSALAPAEGPALERGAGQHPERAALAAEGVMSDLAYLTLAQASNLIRAKKLSPIEYTEALLRRTERLDPRLHAYIRLTPEIALAGARGSENEIVAGNWRGPLHGVPVGLKDIIDYAGLPTSCHSKVLI